MGLMKRISQLNVAILTISLISCSNNESIALPLPQEPPERPTEQSLECLDDATYGIIVKAYKRLETLRAVIESTH